MPSQINFASVESRVPMAVFSECTWHKVDPGDCSPACEGRAYRYVLYWPTGVDNDQIALGVFANPSTASAEETDPTVARWINYCKRWGYGWAAVVNVRAWRATDPKNVPPDPKAIGVFNDSHILEQVGAADLVVCGWGKLGGKRGEHVLGLIRSARKTPHALKLNQDGSPAHPLYLRGDLLPFAMEAS
jgi:hypothetical protein